MHTNKANKSIGCVVNNCMHHCQHEQYCSLDKIQIGSHRENPKTELSTDCMSFELK